MKKIITILVMLTSMQSHGVQLSEDGTGQVLIFPYYTVNNDFNSLLTITNTTEHAKALRVRFREAANSREVFTFNLYLGANDVWVAAIRKTDGENVELLTSDNSCTVPNLHNQTNLFSKSHYTGDMQDAYGDDDNRLFEGFVEVIEMGELTGNSQLAATLVELGTPPPYNCNDLVNAWDANHANNYWVQDATTNLLPPRGGISGDLTLISVLDGIAMNAKPTVIENFSNVVLHHNIDNDSPSLADGMRNSTIKNNSTESTIDLSWDTGIQALSAVLMKNTVENEYEVNADFGAQTTWLVTLPTKQYFTDPLYSNQTTAQAPFINPSLVDITNTSCISFGVSTSNRESDFIPTIPGSLIGIPPPTQIEDAISYLCNASNTISINYDTYDTNTTTGIFDGSFPIKSYYGNNNYKGINTPFHSGKSIFYFAGTITNSNASSINGLPVIAFSAQKYQNGLLANNTLANYGTISQHKSKTYADVLNPQQEELNEKFGMSIAKDNHGQVLIYPYYTVKNGINSLLSVVNTSDEVKAVRVKFREGKNARDALDFNLYLAPYDIWTAQLKAIESSVFEHEGEPSVSLQTSDNSCLVPNNISLPNGQEFLPYGYENPNPYDGKGHSLERVQEGFIEIIEMGSLTGEDAGFATYINGAPLSCESLQQNWSEGGKWFTDPNLDIQAPNGSGNLYGSLQLISVADGIDMKYDAVAITGYSTQAQHSHGGIELPDLTSGNIKTTLIENNINGGLMTTEWDSPLDAVSALFMHDTTSNAYDINAFAGAQTDWIVMSPTRHYYTDTLYDANNPSRPYSGGLIMDNDYCQEFTFQSFDREQKPNSVSNPVPSPPPPGNYDEKLCHSINVSFADNSSTFLNPTGNSLFDSQLLIEDWMVFNGNTPMYHMQADEGVMQMNLDDGDKLVGINAEDNTESHTIYGKPIISFTAQKYVNGNLGNGVLANYSVIKEDSTTRKIEIVAPAQ